MSRQATHGISSQPDASRRHNSLTASAFGALIDAGKSEGRTAWSALEKNLVPVSEFHRLAVGPHRGSETLFSQAGEELVVVATIT